MTNTNTADLIINSATSFYNDLKEDENGRYRSWEYCYSHFYKARGNENVDIDYLSLQLAFYLASWGRELSFLLQKDYKVHIPDIKELLKEKYNPLIEIECVALKKGSNQKLLIKLNNYISDYYDKIIAIR